MPYCTFCGKLCTTAPGLERHIVRTPECKKASCEKFGQYANSIWDDILANPNHAEQQTRTPNIPDFPDSDFPDFHLDENIQTAEEMLYGEEINLPPQPPPPPPDEPQQHGRHPTVEDVTDEIDDGGCYIENFPEEYLAGAIWGHCKPLFESLDDERVRDGGSCWAPFDDEDEWQLAEWLIRNVGQNQTDTFLKLPIVSFFFLISLSQYILSNDRQKNVCNRPLGVIRAS